MTVVYLDNGVECSMLLSSAYALEVTDAGALCVFDEDNHLHTAFAPGFWLYVITQ